MALPATAVWEVRTTGENTNGGGFNSARGGTDYSQQDAAEVFVDGTLSTSGAGATTVSSGSDGFPADCVGNIGYLDGGGQWTTGFYEIVTRTDAQHVVLDRSPTPGGAGVAGSIRVGGATNSPQTIDGVLVNGNTIYVKTGTYTLTRAVALAASTLLVEGYTTTRGDGATTYPACVLDINGVDAHVLTVTGNYVQVRYLTVTNNPARAKNGVNWSGSGGCLYRLRAHNIGRSGIYCDGIGNAVIGCEASNCSNSSAFYSAIYLVGRGVAASGCFVHDSAAAGFYSAAIGVVSLYSCIAARCDSGIRLSTAYNSSIGMCSNCVAYGCTSGGFDCYSSSTSYIHFDNCISVANDYGIATHATAYGAIDLSGGIAFYGNTTAEIQNEASCTVFEPVDRLSLETDPFVDAANNDFRLKTNQRTLLGSGHPAAFLMSGAYSTSTGHPDYGALQQVVRPVGVVA